MLKFKRASGSTPLAQLLGCATLVGLLLLALRFGVTNNEGPSRPRSNELSAPRVALVNDTMFVGLLDVMLVTITSHAETAGKLGPEFWHQMGNIAEVKQEILDYLSYAEQPGIKTLCEVGFNAGHSATVLLSASQETMLYVFDISNLPYSAAHVKLLKRLFGERLHFLKGDSVNLLPWFKQHKTQCDLFSIDGDHSYEGAITDFWNALQLMHVGSSLVADDVCPQFPGVIKAWGWLLSNGYVRQQHCNAFTLPRGLRKGWCMGHVLKVPTSADAVPPGYKRGQAVTPEMQ